ncbi:MAG: Fic family protein, partial [Longimicrobiales bacterium]|nr:Fic family protein [Longimicrobiales bacterium]
GWWMSSSPNTPPGDTTPWYASFWEFCSRYCTDRFGKEWHLSPELSILLHTEATAVPPQVVVYSPQGTNNTVDLLFGTSIYDLKHAPMPAAADLAGRDGLRLFTPSAALIRVPESFFRRFPVEAQVALSSVRDASDVLDGLLEGGHSVVAGRLAGAFRRIGRADVADEINAAMEAAQYAKREADPFDPGEALAEIPTQALPIIGRLGSLWKSMRHTVIESFPPPPSFPLDPEAYLRLVDEMYEIDAYHSLSIEGYRVTSDLIERVRAGDWDPERRDDDRRDRDALAARGYWQAFQAVKATVGTALTRENSGVLARSAHRVWYRELFQPFVSLGVLSASALAGYRSEAVYLRGSRHVPPRWEAVRDAMPALFDLLENEPQASVRAVLGHWLFGYIHPYPDGNGRIARFLMNVMLASGGYPWTVIHVEDRDSYMAALEAASVLSDIRPFSQLVAERVSRSMEAMAQEPLP